MIQPEIEAALTGGDIRGIAPALKHHLARAKEHDHADHRRPSRPRRSRTFARADFKDVAGELRELLGPRLAAYIGGVRETRAIRQWAEGERTPSETVQQRHRVALLLSTTASAKIAQAWFEWLNPQLEDRSPARLLRDGDIDETGPAVISAARAFLIGG